MKVADAMFAHQARGLLCDAQAISLQPVMCMNAVVFASGHGTFLSVGDQQSRQSARLMVADPGQKIS
jgi:hypothetical protein